MPYVQRVNGQIVGVYATPQPGLAEEELAADATDVTAYFAGLTAAPAITYKADIWRRATDAEAVTIEAGFAAQPVRLVNMFRDARYLSHADPMFATIRNAFIAAFGQARADELLAPSA